MDQQVTGGRASPPRAVPPHRRGAVLWAAGIATAALAVLASWPDWDGSVWAALLAVKVAIPVALVVAGTRVVLDQRHVGNGLLLLGAGIVDLFAIALVWDTGPWPVLAWGVSPLVVGLLAWLMLRYPEDRVDDAVARMYVIVLLAWIVGVRALEILLWDPAWKGYTGAAWWPTLIHVRGLHTVVNTMYWVGVALASITFLLLFVRHRRALGGLSRRESAPLWIAVGVGVAVWGVITPICWLCQIPWTSDGNVIARDVENASEAIGLLAIVACLIASLVARHVERARVTELLRPGAARTPEELQSALRTALDDPTLRLLFRPTDGVGWVDVAGRQDLDPARPTRELVVLGEPSDPIAAVSVSASTAGHEDVLAASLEAARLALENVRLQALAQARLREVEASRAQLARHDSAQRRQLERDLHDGAQQRLLAVSAGLARVRATSDDPEVQEQLDLVRSDVRVALQELRDLAHGLHPAVLSQSGLGPAVASAAERLPITVSSEIDGRRCPPEVEAAGYYVVSEALVNVVKHAGATRAVVRSGHEDGALVVRIEDDGSGGAHPHAVGGLNGLRERVAALGGALTVASPPGRGTLVEARIPCGVD